MHEIQYDDRIGSTRPNRIFSICICTKRDAWFNVLAIKYSCINESVCSERIGTGNYDLIPDSLVLHLILKA